MERYINADALMKKLNEDPIGQTIVQRYNIDGFIEAFPTADVVEVKHGKWEKMWHSYFKQELPCCSVCGHFSAMRWKYCPNCGADMRKETEDED